MRQYFGADPYLFESGVEDITYKNFKDITVDLKYCNFTNDTQNEFNWVSHNRVIIENDEEDYYYQYIIFRIWNNQIIYGCTTKAIEFDPSKACLLYYKKIKFDQFFDDQIIQFYFNNRPTQFRPGYPEKYTCLFRRHVKAAKQEYEIFKLQDHNMPEFFSHPEMPRWFNLTEQNINKAVMDPATRRSYVWDKKMNTNFIDESYENEYRSRFENKRVSNRYDINNPEGMFFDFYNDSTPDLSYMFINGERCDFDMNSKSVTVPKGNFALYYNKRNHDIGIRFVGPSRWWEGKKPQNPVERSYVYLKQLSDIEKNDYMDPITIDFYTKDHFHLYRLKYDKEDIENLKDKWVSTDDFENKFYTRKNSYEYNPQQYPSWSDRQNPYLNRSFRSRY